MRLIQITAVVAFMLAATSADGTTWTVCPPPVVADFPTIQAALDDSSVVDTDVIVVCDGTYVSMAGYMNIDFNGKLVTVRSASGNPVNCVIDGAGANRAFIFPSATPVTREAEVFGIRMINCDAYEGGAVYCDQSSPTFSNCIFSGNSATSWGGAVALRQSDALFDSHCRFYQNSAGLDGGAVRAVASDAEFVDCDFYYSTLGNSAQRGGALYALSGSDLTLTRCEFNNNTASADGGAVYIDNSSDPSFVACSFDNNSAASDGGGCFIDRTSQPTFSTCTFGSVTENTAGLRGGAVFSRDGSTVTFDGCSFDDCQAGVGGGGAIFVSDTVINVSGSDFGGNVAGTRGGALRIRDISTAEVTDCEFLGNSASVHGGAISSSHDSVLTVTGGHFEQNVAIDKGGALASEDSTATVSAVNSFTGNSAADGGAIASLAGPITVSNCDFIGNTASMAGAGLHTEGGDVAVSDSTFSGNIAVIAGGGLLTFQSPNVTIEDSSFDNNRATDGMGGGAGGGLATYEGSVSVDGCDFKDNFAGAAGGGARHIGTIAASVEYKWCRFVGNVAGTAGGGGVAIHDLPATLHNCDFYGNDSYDCGGAIDAFAQVTTSFDLANCLFSCNTTDYAGGAVRVANSGTSGTPITTGTIGNCTFSHNETTDPTGTGGGLCIGGVAPGASDVGVDNSIFWENLDSSGNTFDAQIYLDPFSPGSIRRFDNSCFTAPACPPASYLRPPTGTGTNICAAPLFLDPDGPDNICGTEDDNLRLMVGSPCIDAADNTAVPPDTLDLDDDPGTTAHTPLDLDARERFMDDPTAVDTGVPCVHYPDDIVEMGCYERCPGDIDGDGDVDLSDLALLLAAYGCCDPEPCYNPAADLDDDGCVDLGDLALLLAVYGGC